MLTRFIYLPREEPMEWEDYRSRSMEQVDVIDRGENKSH